MWRSPNGTLRNIPGRDFSRAIICKKRAAAGAGLDQADHSIGSHAYGASTAPTGHPVPGQGTLAMKFAARTARLGENRARCVQDAGLRGCRACTISKLRSAILPGHRDLESTRLPVSLGPRTPS